MKSADAVGRVCKNPDCNGARLGLQLQTRDLEWKIGSEVFQLQVRNVPVAQCSRCKATVKGDDTLEAEQTGFINAVSEFWIGRILKANGHAAEILKLRVLFRRVAKSFKDPKKAAELMGTWFSQHEKLVTAGLGAVPEPVRAPKTG
jgi:hypothetical protein